MLKTILPESNVPSFVPNTNVTFNLSLENEQLVKKSIYLTGRLTITPPTADATAVIEIDKWAGIHNFFDHWICDSQRNGRMQTLSNYGRYVRHLHLSNLAIDELGFNKDGEGMYLTDAANTWINADQIPSVDGSFDSYFCFKPYFQYNRSADDLSYDKFGNLSVQFYLADRIQCMTLTDEDLNPAGLSYSISDLKMHYQSVPDQKVKGPVIFETYYSSPPTNMMTNSVTIDKNVGSMMVEGVQGSFIAKAHDKQQGFSCVGFEDIGVTKIQFAFNDFTNNYIQFALDNAQEILYNAISALNLNEMKKYGYNAQEFITKSNTMIGLRYPQPLDMTQKKFSCTITNANATVGNSFSCYLFFYGFTSQ